MDYEHQPANHVAFRGARTILLPEAVPGGAVRRQGAAPRKVSRYAGLKEEVYLADFEPDAGILDAARGRAPGRRRGRRRPLRPGRRRLPPRREPDLRRLPARARRARATSSRVALARHAWQRDALRGARPRAPASFPSGAVDARSLLYAADAFVGAGGTMSREAALLGLADLERLRRPRPAVDAGSRREGRLRALTTPGSSPTLGPRDGGAGADLARLAPRAERDPARLPRRDRRRGGAATTADGQTPIDADRSRVPFVDLAPMHAEIAARSTPRSRRRVERGDFILGAEVERFEADFAAYCGAEHAVGVASGTVALQIADRSRSASSAAPR